MRFLLFMGYAVSKFLATLFQVSVADAVSMPEAFESFTFKGLMVQSSIAGCC